MRLTLGLVGRDWRDHSSLTDQLNGGRVTMAAQGPDRFFRLTVAIAPSTRLRPKRTIRLPKPQAWEFVDAARPAVFDVRPAFSGGDAVRFEAPAFGKNAPRRQAEIWKTGLVAFTDPLTMGDDSVHPSLDLFRVAVLLRNGANAVRSGAYARLLGGRPSRWRRVDWFVAVTPSIVTDDGQKEWSHLECPGVEQLSESTNPVRWVPPSGYGARRLRGVSQRLKPVKLVRIVLDDLLRYCGFYDFEQTIRETTSAMDRFSGTGDGQ